MEQRGGEAGTVASDRASGLRASRATSGRSAVTAASRIRSARVTDLSKRTTEEVFIDHLELRKLGRLEEDIKRNYDEHVVIISNVGTFFGHDGVRHSAQLLRLLLPTLDYKFDTLLIRGQIAFEEWEARASAVEVHNGIDAFVISDGKIKIQTIWYESEARKKAAPRGRARA